MADRRPSPRAARGKSAGKPAQPKRMRRDEARQAKAKSGARGKGGQPPQHQDRKPGREYKMRPRPQPEHEHRGSGKLDGRIALITGGDSGIGRAVAVGMAREGARIAFGYLDEQRDAEETVRLVEAENAEAFALAGDIGEEAVCRDLVKAAVGKFGRLDILVNNAAGNFFCLAKDLSPNGFGAVVDIDLKGTFNVSRAAYPFLKARGGAVLNISATLQLLGTIGQAHASAAKAGIDALTRTLAAEWGRDGIRVNGVAPGPVEDTEGVRRLATPESIARINQLCPLGRLATIDDIAAITGFNERYLKAINDEDIAALSALTTDSHVMLPPNQEPVVGKAANDAMNGGAFERYEFSETWVPVETVIDGDLGFQRGTFTVIATPRGDGDRLEVRGSFLRIYQRQRNGEWRMTRDMFNSSAPLTETLSTGQ